MIPNRIARLNSNGATDTSFDPGAGLDAEGICVNLDATGQVIAGGSFNMVSGSVRAKLALFEADGTLITGTPTPSATVRSLATQASGEIILGGDFTTVDGTTRNRIARLLPDLSLEAGFNPNASASVHALALQTDGEVLVGGSFTTVGETARNNVARLFNGVAANRLYATSAVLILWDRTGTNEETQRVTFEIDTGSGYGPLAGTISRNATGWQIIPDTPLSGATNNIRATAFPSDSHSSGAQQTLASLAILPEIAVSINNESMTDGLSTFSFPTLQVGATSTATVTISNTGLDELTLTSAVTASGQWEIASQPTTAIPSLTSVSFDLRFEPTSEGPKTGVLSIFSDDSDEATFTVALTGEATVGPGGLDLTWQPTANKLVRALVKSSDDSIWLGGDFTTLGTTSRPRLARIDKNAVLQAQAATIIPVGTINCIAQLPDGTALVGGQFSTKKLYWVGFAPSGEVTLKTSFDLVIDPVVPAVIPYVNCMAVQADGSVLVGGRFNGIKIGSVTRRGILIRLLFSSGVASIDTTFSAGTTNRDVRGIAIQTDGKIVFCNGGNIDPTAPKNEVIRVTSVGARDTTFAAQASRGVNGIALDSQGRVFVEGASMYIDGAPAFGVSRLSSSGALDETFTLVPSAALSLLPMVDGTLVVASGASGTLASASRLEKFLTDGTADTSFISAITGTVRTVCSQEDGALLIGGSFGTISGALTSVRIVNSAASTALTVVDATKVQWLRSGALPETQVVVFDMSQDSGGTWIRLGQGQRIAGGWHLPSIALPYSGLLRARAYIQSAGNSSIMEDQISFSGLAVSDLIVQVPNTEIVEDGGTASAVSAVAGSILPVTIRLVNTGLAEMTGVVATVTTAPVAGTGKWSLYSAPNSTIPAGGSSTMVANFTPSSSDKGLLYANLVITSSVPGIKNPYTVLLVGAAVALPTAMTNAPNNTGGGVVTFNGTFVANDLTATAYFRYRVTSSSTWISTSALSKSGYAAQTGSVTVSSLSIGVSYTVQAVIVNSSNVTSPVYGASVAVTPIP